MKEICQDTHRHRVELWIFLLQGEGSHLFVENIAAGEIEDAAIILIQWQKADI